MLFEPYVHFHILVQFITEIFCVAKFLRIYLKNTRINIRVF